MQKDKREDYEKVLAGVRAVRSSMVHMCSTAANKELLQDPADVLLFD